MKKVLAILAILSLVGCASTGDVENLQAQIDTLNTDVAAAQSQAAAARISAVEAANSAADAETITAIVAIKVNALLDAMFKTAVQK